MTRVVREPARTRLPSEPEERVRHEFRDVRHPRVPEVRVDLVLIAPSGVNVVTWAPSTHQRNPEAGPDVDPGWLAASRSASELLADLLPPRYQGHVRPVLCRTDDRPGAETVEGVLVTTRNTLAHILRSSPVVLSTSELNEVARSLDARLETCPATNGDRPVRRARHRVLAALVAAASLACTAVLLREVTGVPLPW